MRSTEFFNCNPNLAGLALGATTRAEYEAVPGEQIARLRTALCSPLGALGDELFWTGAVPALVGAALAAVVLGAGWWAIAGLLIVYNVFRLGTAIWSLRTGFDAGMKVGAAISASWVPRAVARMGPVAGFTVGVAIPLVAGWFLAVRLGRRDRRAGARRGGRGGHPLVRPGATTVRFTLLAMLLLLLFRRVGL